MFGIRIQRFLVLEFHDERAVISLALHFDRLGPDGSDAGNLAGHFADAVINGLLLGVGCSVVPLNGHDVHQRFRLIEFVRAKQHSCRKQAECAGDCQYRLLTVSHK